MKATDNQILMLAGQIASAAITGIGDNIVNVDKDKLASVAVNMAEAIANAVPEDDDTKIDDKEVHDVIYNYCMSHEGIPAGKLNSQICTGEGMTAKRAKHLIYRAEKLGIIENIGTRWPVYILRKKQGYLGKYLDNNTETV